MFATSDQHERTRPGYPKPVLTPFQQRKLARRFRLFDPQRSGRIGWDDIQHVLDNVLETSGWSMDSARRAEFQRQGLAGWQLLAAAADVDRNGEVDLDEWYAFDDPHVYPFARDAGSLPDGLDRLNDLSFEMMDAAGNGLISLPEYRQHLIAYGVPDEGLADHFRAIDADGDNTISRDEWRTLNFDFYLGDDPLANSAWLWGDVFKTFFH